MIRRSVALALVLTGTGCAGTRVPPLAKCMGPYRYANPNGTVLPSLPIPGQPSPPPSAPSGGSPAPPRSPSPPSASDGGTRPSSDPTPPPPPASSPPKTSALDRAFPSC